EVSVGRKNSSSQDISHQYAVVHAKEKFQALKRIIDFNEDFFGIVFCTTRLETQDISDSLIKSGYNADCLHGDLSQQQRDKVMGKFRKRVVKILCATDVAARGIDVNDITHVIHYHLPDDIENYTHRSGRTARAGKKGISIALLHTREAYKLHQIEKMANMKFEKFMIPQGEDIISKRVQKFVTDFVDMDYKAMTTVPVKNEWTFPLMQMEKEELVARIMAKEFQKLDTNYLQPTDLNVDERGRSDRRSGGQESEGRFGRGSRGGQTDRVSTANPGDIKLSINLGKKDNIRYDEMRELIFKHTKVSGHHIKDIDMQGAFSTFQTDAKSAERIMDGIKGFDYNGRDVFVKKEFSREGGNRGGFKGGSSSAPKTKKYGTGFKGNSSSSSKPRSRKGDMSW
ncbi:MAG: DbpA RNA binding domain-containing protein, partial [Chitinophagaceae bacterium]|nr:DbpA RNA binding domain-containing protein [Chitinophagaceae bacterium]